MPIKRDALTLGTGISNKIAKNFLFYTDFNVELRGSGVSRYIYCGGFICVHLGNL